MSEEQPWRLLTEALLGTPALTSTEVAAAAAVDLEFARRLWRALGFPPAGDNEHLFTTADVAVLKATCELRDRLAIAPALLFQLARVTGHSLGRLADAQIAAIAEPRDESSAPAALADVDVPSDLVALLPELERLLRHVWRRHLVAAFARIAAIPAGADRILAVGFADLVGFTAMTQALDADALAALVDRFEATAYEHVLGQRGWVVKMIGDEVMFAAADAIAAARIGLALARAHQADATLPPVRVGLAHGPTLAWEGDLVGQTVNLAHRLVNLARPGTVLVSDGLGKQLAVEADFTLRHLRPVRLQGIGPVRPWVLRNAEKPRRGEASERRARRAPAE
jgi:adenylate cyclase